MINNLPVAGGAVGLGAGLGLGTGDGLGLGDGLGDGLNKQWFIINKNVVGH